MGEVGREQLRSEEEAHEGVPWWRRSVVYQVFVPSFRDADGDGLGDIDGIRERLDYLADLGVDALWLTPFYPHGGRDAGYDITDFRDVADELGTLDDVRRLVEEAHERGVRILLDVVPNHTSWDHPWFEQALAAGPGSAARERFHFHDGTGPDGDEPPNNWPSNFGGAAWTRVSELPASRRPDDEQWYLHLFDEGQPDLNWRHEEVQAEFGDVLRFWLELGVDGFRVDVAHALTKDPEYADLPEDLDPWPDKPGSVLDPAHPFLDRDDLHPHSRRWRTILDRFEGRMMVAEAYVPRDRLFEYVGPDEYHQAFTFEFLLTGWDGPTLRELVRETVAAAQSVDSTPTWVQANHDQMRPPTRYGLPTGTDTKRWYLDGSPDELDEVRGQRRARAMALVLLALPGSAYVYQGEELGLPDVWDLPADVLRDPTFRRSDGEVKGRDGCRVPPPWRADAPNLGFGDGSAYLPQPDSYRTFAADVQDGDPTSILALYREAIELRRRHARDDEQLTMLDLGDEHVLAFRRGSGLTCVATMGEQPTTLPPGEVLLSSVPLPGDGTLPVDAAVWLLA